MNGIFSKNVRITNSCTRIMSDYQFLIGVGDGITSELTLSKVVSNQCDIVPSSIEYKVGVYTQDSQSTEWVKVDERIFGRSIFLSFSSKSL